MSTTRRTMDSDASESTYAPSLSPEGMLVPPSIWIVGTVIRSCARTSPTGASACTTRAISA
jgi:hypothetical protein